MDEETILKKNDSRKLCPFIEESFEDCYITNMKSQNTESIIYYCGGDFQKCEMYKRHKLGKLAGRKPHHAY